MRADFPGVRYVVEPLGSYSRDRSRGHAQLENAREPSHTRRHKRLGVPRELSYTLEEERLGGPRRLSQTSREQWLGDARRWPGRDELQGDTRERSHNLRYEHLKYEGDRYIKDSGPLLPPRSNLHAFEHLEDILQNLSLYDRNGDARVSLKHTDYAPSLTLEEQYRTTLLISPGINHHEQKESYQEELDRLGIYKRRELAHLKSDRRRIPGPKLTLPNRFDGAGDARDRSGPRREVLPAPPVLLPVMVEIPRYKGRDERRGDRIRATQVAVVRGRVPQYGKGRREEDGLREKGSAYLRECRQEERGSLGKEKMWQDSW